MEQNDLNNKNDENQKGILETNNIKEFQEQLKQVINDLKMRK